MKDSRLFFNFENRIAQHLNLCFLGNSKHSNSKIGFLETFPLLRNSIREGNFEVLFDETQSAQNSIVAFCAWSFLNLSNGNSVANIGGVSVHPNKQGKGLALQILRKSVATINSQHVSNIVLFSNNNKLYERVGFKVGTMETMYEIKSKIADRVSINETPSLLHKLLNTFEIGVDFLREIKDFFEKDSLSKAFLWHFEILNVVFKTPNMKICVTYQENKIAGFFFIGKGIDFFGVVHGIHFAEFDFFLSALSFCLLHSESLKYILCEPIFSSLNRRILEKFCISVETGSSMMFLGNEVENLFVPSILAS